MAGRGASAAVLAEIEASSNSPCHLFEAYWPTQTIRLTDAHRAIVWGGNTYLASGAFLSFSGIEETADIQVSQAQVVISGVDQAWISLALSDEYLDRRLVIYKAFLDASDVLIVDPFPIHDGRMDAPIIAEDVPDGGVGTVTSTVTISSTSHFVDFQRSPGRRTNHQDSQIHFPGEKGFEFVSSLNREIIWGAPSPAGQSAPGVSPAAPVERFDANLNEPYQDGY